MSTVTRLTAEFAAVKINKTTPQQKPRSKYTSPENFASGLKPMCPQWTQSRAAYLRSYPLWHYCPELLEYLKVQPFALAPKARGITTRRRRKLRFNDIINTSTSVVTLPKEPRQQTTLSPSRERQYLNNSTFKDVIHQHKIGKLRNPRRFRRSLPSLNMLEPSREVDPKPSYRGFTAPVRTKPFDENVEWDAFEFFPELQYPFSPLKNDSERYLEEDRRQKEGKELTYGQRRLPGESPFTPSHIKDMIHRTLCMGKYEWKRLPVVTTTTPESSPSHREGLVVEESQGEVGEEQVIVGSPMDIDDVVFEGSPMKIDGIM